MDEFWSEENRRRLGLVIRPYEDGVSRCEALRRLMEVPTRSSGVAPDQMSTVWRQIVRWMSTRLAW